MFKDFRDYLKYLEDKGKLLRVRKEVDTRFDIAAGIRKASKTDGPALLFENVRGFPGWRVVGGIYATQKLMALALGLSMQADEQSMIDRYLEFDNKYIKPRIVKTGPVKEIIIKGKDVDLTRVPVPIYSELDVGPYLTAGVEIGKDPRTGVQNISIHRRLILGKNQTTILARGQQQLGKLIQAAEDEGKGLAIATVIGMEPSLPIASQIMAPLGVDETEIAGAFRGEPLEMVKCETIDVEVPANAEMIIEGTTIPGQKALCGPFGEHPGNYITMTGAPQWNTHVIEVTAITMRKEPIFQALLSGTPMTENHYIKKWAITAYAYRAIEGIADITAMNYTSGGAAHYNLVVAIDKKDDLEPKKIMDALANVNRGPRNVTVVDSDINVYDPIDIEWAVTTRANVNEDVLIVRSSPSAPGRLFIDATAPLKEKKWYRKAITPGLDKVDYL